MSLTRVNMVSVANAAASREEIRNGRKVIIVPSATLPDDVVMNDILYPAEEIAKSYTTLNNTPAPLGHPSLPDGSWLSARDPEGINRSWIGAWNENATQRNGKVYLDKVIDVEVANRSEGGRAVLAAIEAGQPVHTSTGLYVTMENAANGEEGHKSVARNIVADHDAILLDEEGAATPTQGVGMMVNAAQGLPVVNSRVEWAEKDLEWAADHLIDSAERLAKAEERQSFVDKVVAVLRDMMPGTNDGDGDSNGQQEENMSDNDQTIALNKRMDAMEASIAEAVSNAVAEAVKPLVEANEAAVKNAKDAEAAEREALTKKIVNAAVRDEDECAHLPVANLRKIADGIKNGQAAPLGKGADDPDKGVVNFRLPGSKKEA